MTLRAFWAVCWAVAVLTACSSDSPDPPPTVSTGDGDGGGDDRDASFTESPDAQASGPPELPPDAGEDAGSPPPAPPATDGVHLSIERRPYETATDAFFFEAARPGIAAQFLGATLRVVLIDTPSTVDCREGASIEYEVADGRLSASHDVGMCTIVIEAFGSASGDPIEATFHAIVERTRGEIADSLELHGRIQVGHP